MRHARTLILAGVVVAAATAARTSYSSSIVGSKHDLSGAAWNTSKTICGVCHTPHNAITGQPALWNHQVSTATYTLYSSPTMQATVGQPGGLSKLCLSCHDGTVALENFGGVTGGTNIIPAATKVGTDLSNDHPLGFTYDTALATADGQLFDPATAQWNGAGSGTIASKMLFAGKLECPSCHNPHDNANGFFLRKSNTGSALCLTCHNK